MSFYFGARKPLGYMQDMFTPVAKTDAGYTARGDDTKPPPTTTCSLENRTKTQMPQRTQRMPTAEGSEALSALASRTPYPYTPQHSRPFWSRLLCTPEVFDPHIEAAPVGGSLTLHPSDDMRASGEGSFSLGSSQGCAAETACMSGTASPRETRSGQNQMIAARSEECMAQKAGEKGGNDSDDHQREQHHRRQRHHRPHTLTSNASDKEKHPAFSSEGMGSHQSLGGSITPECHPSSASSSLSSSLASSRSTNSEGSCHTADDGCPDGETGHAATPVVGRNVFTVFDTRAAASFALHYRLNAHAAAEERGAGPEFMTPLSPHVTADEQHRASPALSEAAAPATAYYDEDTEEYEEREKARMQGLVEKRWRRTEQQKLQAKLAKEERVAIRTLALAEQQRRWEQRQGALGADGDTTLEAANAGTIGGQDVYSPVNPSPPPPPFSCVAAASAPATMSFNLAAARGYSSVEKDGYGRPTSPTLSSVEGSVFIDDEHTDVLVGAEEVYQQRFKQPQRAVAVTGLASSLSLGSGSCPIAANDSLEVETGSRSCATAIKPFAETAAARAFPLPVRYPLGSRAYMDRVLFAQRSQQVYALMALLTEAHRTAWQHYLRLIQLYYYYINPLLLSAPSASMAAQWEASLLACGSQSLRLFHEELRVSGADYQYLKYRFDQPWRQLFLHVRHYLNIDEAQHDGAHELGAKEVSDVQPLTADTAGPCLIKAQATGSAASSLPEVPLGTVCFAATLLHSMELFERYQPLQAAVRETETWLTTYGDSLSKGALACDASQQTSTELEAGCSPDASPDSPKSRQSAPGLSVGEQPPRLPLSAAYVPMNWSMALDDKTRNAVYWARRQHKLALMALADRALLREKRRLRKDAHSHHKKLHATGRQGLSETTGSCVPSAGPPETSLLTDYATLDVEPLTLPVSPPSPTDPVPDACFARAVQAHEPVSGDWAEDAAAEGSTLPPDTYRVVNVGCFGFSFKSLFD